MKKKISFSDFKNLELELKSKEIINKSNKNNFQINIFQPITPKTNIEKVVEVLNEIADEFDKSGNTQFHNKTKFVINEIVSNKMYNFDDSTSKEHLNFFNIYSSNINEEQLSHRQKKGDEIEIDKNKRMTFIYEEIKLIDISEFGVTFDVFSYADKVGRVNLLRQVFLSAFNYKDIISMFKTSYLDDYIEELRIGYTSEEGAFYHNVRIFNISIYIYPISILYLYIFIFIYIIGLSCI